VQRLVQSLERPFLFATTRAIPNLHESLCLVRLSGENLRTTSALMNAFSIAFDFPDYFGGNWNALYDCLTDLDWLPPPGYVLFVANAFAVLADEPAHPDFGEPSELAVFLDMLDRVSEEWNKPVDEGQPWDRAGVPFHVVFEVDSERLALFQNRVAFARRHVPLLQV
jgi:Barstar (barnase inhibitor)